jgi:hypothetical protein
MAILSQDLEKFEGPPELGLGIANPEEYEGS